MGAPLKILLVAYEFPPSASPQSLRWAYLVRELVRAGHEVHVLAPDVRIRASDLLDLVSGSVIHRVYPGPCAGLAAWCGRLLARAGGASARPGVSVTLKGPARPGLNWKGRLSLGFKKAAGFFLFPDIRAEWNPWARRRLRQLLPVLSPDVVISSHEPASTVAIGRVAHAQGYPWVVDFGDPLLSPYTPRRWRRRAFRLERFVMKEADAVLVTSERTREMLALRHPAGRAPCHVVTQGFDGDFRDQPDGQVEALFDDTRLELLYTGRLYAFRRIDWLLEAVTGEAPARLTVITHAAPPVLLAAAERFPERIRVIGALPHRTVLAMQRRCDVLVNVANDDPVQVPGKFYEYLGAGKPILHVRGAAVDAVTSMLVNGGHEDFIVSDVESLSALLRRLSDQKASGLPWGGRSLAADTEEYTWRVLAQRVATICKEAAARHSS